MRNGNFKRRAFNYDHALTIIEHEKITPYALAMQLNVSSAIVYRALRIARKERFARENGQSKANSLTKERK